MKKILIAFSALALSGCCAFTEIGKFDPNVPVSSNHGEKPVAIINVANVSYKLLHLIPISSGQTWQKGSYEQSLGSWNATMFRDKCTVDENLASVRMALKYLGKDRIADLTTDTDSWSFWSLFLIKRTVVKTSCVVFD